MIQKEYFHQRQITFLQAFIAVVVAFNMRQATCLKDEVLKFHLLTLLF
jgi:hypothetical protein